MDKRTCVAFVTRALTPVSATVSVVCVASCIFHPDQHDSKIIQTLLTRRRMCKTACIAVDASSSWKKYTWRQSDWFVTLGSYRSRLMDVLAAITKSTRSSLIKLAYGHWCCRFRSRHVVFTKVISKGKVCSSIAGVPRKVGADVGDTYI